MKKTIEINDENFTEIANKTENLLIDFYAPWCGPCRMLSPILDDLSKDETINTTIGKVNTDDSPLLASAMKIRHLPSIFFFKKGEPISKLQGPATSKTLLNFIKENE